MLFILESCLLLLSAYVMMIKFLSQSIVQVLPTTHLLLASLKLEKLWKTVQREVLEETGLRVKNIRYYKSQPWGIVDDILAGFYCDVDGETDIHMDESELKLAEWKTREELELQPDDFSLTNEMMLMFKNGRM